MPKGGNVKKALGALEDMAEGIHKLVRTHYEVHVGILGHKAGRNEIVKTKSGKRKENRGHPSLNSLTNAELGLIHEKGSLTAKIPPRSFLVKPLKMKEDELKKMSAADLNKLFKTGKVMLFLKRIGKSAEKIIQQAFATGGFGMWWSLEASTKARKNSSAILIDSGQLRRSISSRVVE